MIYIKSENKTYKTHWRAEQGEITNQRKLLANGNIIGNSFFEIWELNSNAKKLLIFVVALIICGGVGFYTYKK